MINNSPPDGSTCTPTPPARRDGAFYANKSSCLKTFTFLIGLFMGKICFWVTLCQKGILRCPPTQGSAQRQALGAREVQLDPLTEIRHKGGASQYRQGSSPSGFFFPPPQFLPLGPHSIQHRPILCFALSFLWQHACKV